MLSILLISVTGLWAQRPDKQGPPQVPKAEQITKMIQDLDKELGLSSEQETKLTSLFTSHFKTMDAKMKAGERPERSVMEAMKKEFESKVKAVLTPDQQAKFKGLKPPRREGGKRPRQ